MGASVRDPPPLTGNNLYLYLFYFYYIEEYLEVEYLVYMKNVNKIKILR